MVCSICQESYFKAPAEPGGARRTVRTGASTAHRPATLGCGHAFHRQCIVQWFENDYSKTCPQCKVSHHGPIITLYIDLDEEDYDVSKLSGALSSGQLREDEMKQLAQKMLSMNIHEKSAEYFMIGSLTKQIAKLKQSSQASQRQRDELAAVRSQLETERRRAERAEAANEDLKAELLLKDASLDYNRSEVSRLMTLSDRHRNHINNLVRNVEFKKGVIEWYREQYG
ncbi:hypothetical protein IWW37_004564 [Coemansia sp. RSA 2050]|nr:hypothetical protein IWW37_004564 [Coemansia sp. RSA 2050]KAJ2731626.1 hypothetical protein IW152_004392 [Coemansia sp. BCRC 34962]